MNTPKTASLQFLKQQLRDIICEIQTDVAFFKSLKKEADAVGNLDDEYEHHNRVQSAKAQLKRWVAIQCMTKQSLRDEYQAQRNLKRQAEVDKMVARVKASVGEV